MKLTILGSGAVRPDLEHWGPSQVVDVAGERLLFDCGRGASMRMEQANIPLQSIDRVFFTHHHYDHNCDFAYFFLTSWLFGRSKPLEIIGPKGTVKFCDGLLKYAYEDDIASRRGHGMFNSDGEKWLAKDIIENDLCLNYEKYKIKITHTKHKGPHIDNLVFRIEHEDKSMVIVGDTTVNDNLKKFAQGADLMIHECSFPEKVFKDECWQDFHTNPAELGTWAKEAGIKKLAVRHFCLRPGVVELEDLISEVKGTFGEENLIVGKDLLEIEV
ncbi:MAG: MBL fold metallo-hydrolase [Planctomycetota bacterium]|jgi:ribonuclease Z